MNRIKLLGLTALTAGTLFLGGCFATDGGRANNDESGDASLVISMGVRDVDNLSKPGLAKSSVTEPEGIQLSKLIVTLTSSIESDSVIRDTVMADDDLESDFKPDASEAQQVQKMYAIKPLRSWTVEVKTLDVNDSLVHVASDTVENVEVGDVRAVTLNLSSRFVVYVAKFLLPDSIGSSDTNVTAQQKVNINRLVMVVDGDTVVDSTNASYFAPDPTENFIMWPYVSVNDTHTVGLYVYTDSLGGWDPTLPLFGDTLTIADIDSVYAPSLPWTGPGSEEDPNYDPENPGGAQADLTIEIGPVEMVEINPTLPDNPLPRRNEE